MSKCYKCLDTGWRDFVNDQGQPYFSTCSCDTGRSKSGEEKETPLAVAGRMYDPYRHDPDSIGFNDSYTGPSELELGGGCNRCGSPDDCYCDG